MEQRLKNLEDVCELITKEIVEQSKNMIEMNKSLINEIRCLREAYVKQDDDFEEFKNLLRKLYEQNRQQQQYQQQLPPPPQMNANFMHPAAAAFFPPNFPSQAPPSSNTTTTTATTTGANSTTTQPNSSYFPDPTNQSMLNNVSFQSERTPFNMNQLPPSFSNLNTTGSNYSIPSSASGMNLNQQQQQRQQQQQPVVVAAAPFNPQQPPPPVVFKLVQQTSVSSTTTTTTASSTTGATTAATAPFKFAPSLSTTSTPQTTPFAFTKLSPQVTSGQPTPVPTQVPVQAPSFQQPTSQTKPPQFQLSPSKPVATTTTTATFPKPPTTTTTAPTSSPFSGINLFKPMSTGTTATNISQPAPTLNNLLSSNIFTAPPVTTFGSLDQDDESGGNQNPEEYEPEVDFKPIVQLKEVEVKTGEEDEDALCQMRCKLFKFDSEKKEWKEKGLGDIKLLRHKQTKHIRVLMRREQVFKLCANHKITPEMKVTELAPKSLSWLAVDFSDQEAKSEMLLAKFKTGEEATLFKSEFEKAVQASKTWEKSATPVKQAVAVSDKPSLSQALKSDDWKCNACYAPNKKDSFKCACCQMVKPGSEAAAAAEAASPANKIPESKSQPFSFGLSSNNAQQPASSGIKPTFSFGMASTSNTTTTATTTTNTPKFDFTAKENILKSTTTPNLASATTTSTTTTTQQKPLFGTQTLTTTTTPQATTNIFNKDMTNTPTFASLAAKPGSLFGNVDSAASASPIFKPMGFGGGLQNSAQPAKPLFGGAVTTTPLSSGQNNEDGEDTPGNENPEEYEPQVEFKPIVKLSEVEVKTGEEEEDCLFKQRCKLFRFDSEKKEWKEKGVGEIKLLKSKTANVYRLLMRRDQVLKLCINHRLTLDLKFEIQNEKQVRWHAEDYSEGAGRHELLAARFKNESDAKKFKEECEKAQSMYDSSSVPAPTTTTKVADTKNLCQGLKPTLSEMFKGNNGWTCTNCLVNNKEETTKCAACATPKNPNEAPLPTSTTTTTTSQQTPKFSFGTQPTTTTTTTTTPSTTTMDSVFGAKSGMSFADLAQGSKPFGFGGGFTTAAAAGSSGSSSTGLFGAGAKPAPMLFGAKPTTGNEENEEEGGDNQNPEEYEPQVDFKPLVKLSEVEVKTGEEDEEVLFKQRCKLFRFDNTTKEWKEKGTGEMKILKHRVKENSYRVLMRRDQVLKICANHKITGELKLETVTEKQLRWLANDCSEGQAHPELLTVRFRHEEDVKQFRAEFEKAQQAVRLAGPSTTTTSSVNKNVTSVTNTLASLVKKGDWQCDACYATNKETVDKCACCETPRPVASGSQAASSNNENDVIVVHESKASQELIEKARALKLPDNFYLYMNKAECQGCRGCEKNEE